MANRIRLKASGMRELLLSAEVADELAGHAERVADAARRDPNPEYAASIRVTEHRSQGGKARVSQRVGASPAFGMAVEAKRGTLARALGGA